MRPYRPYGTNKEQMELDKRIADLEEVINGYESAYKIASAETRKDLLLQIMNSSRQTLNRLLDEKARTSATESKFLF